MNEDILVYYLIVHYILDFWVQSDWQAKNKSKNNRALVFHTLTYSIGMGFLSIPILGDLLLCFYMFLITFAAHTATDYITSRQVSGYFAKENFRHGFMVVGFDQILHYLQIFLTLKLLMWL